MICDPIVDEVRAIREQLAAEADFDIRKIVADARARQLASKSKIILFQQSVEDLAPSGAPSELEDRVPSASPGPTVGT